MEQVITKYRAERIALYDAIAKRYQELDRETNQVSAVTRLIAKEMGVCVATVYKVRRMAGLNKKVIDRHAMVKFYDSLIADGKANNEAVKLTARRYQCSTGYVYQLIKRFKS